MSVRVIQNTEQLTTSDTRRAALAIAEAGYAAIDTQRVVARLVRLEGDTLHVDGVAYDLAPNGRLFFVGVGKCAADGALAIETICGDRLAGGIALDVSISEKCRTTLSRIVCYNGTHPSPSEANVQATSRILALLVGLSEHDTVIILVSGGGSTLLCSPVSGTCTEEADLLRDLFKCGATIQDINTIRKHASLARGGYMAKAAYPAHVVSLIFSDVPGNDMEFIASGPTVRDHTTIADAQAVLEKYHIPLDPHMLIETPKEPQFFERVSNILAVSNVHALEAMKSEAERLGYATAIVTDRLTGEASTVGRDIAKALHAAPPHFVALYGGETTVTMSGSVGKGGRCQEMALAALSEMQDGELVVPIASDGRDNSDHAGALCDTLVVREARQAGLSIETHLAEHRSYDFFEAVGAAVKTGETGTNVSDLIVAVKE